MGEKDEINAHHLAVDEVFSELGSKKEGLSDKEVSKQRKKHGTNVILIAAYFIPLFHNALSFEELSVQYWLIVGAASLSTLIVIQVVKQIFKI